MQSEIQECRDKYKACKKEYNVVIKTVKTNNIQHIVTGRCYTTNGFLPMSYPR
jgi:hypothetical protein